MSSYDDIGLAQWGLLAACIITVITSCILYKNTLEETFDSENIQAIEGCKWSSKRFVLICNPYGGKKTGRDLVTNVLLPICNANKVCVDVLYTKKYLHAAEMGECLDLDRYDGILIVSGDGLIHEFINGLAKRGSSTEEFQTLASKFPPIGIIPGGTCNGAATSILSSSPENALIKILEGSAQLVDIFRVESIEVDMPAGSRTKAVDVWDIHGCAWAMLSEADEVIGQLRWIPRVLRETVAAAYLIAKKQVYTGTIYFKPYNMELSAIEKLKYSNPNLLPVENEGTYSGYSMIQGSFIMLAAMNMPYASYDAKLCPSSSPTDGGLDLLIMRGSCSRSNLLMTFLTMEDGSHVGNNGIEIYKVTSFALKQSGGCKINVSGGSTFLQIDFSAYHVLIVLY